MAIGGCFSFGSEMKWRQEVMARGGPQRDSMEASPSRPGSGSLPPVVGYNRQLEDRGSMPNDLEPYRYERLDFPPMPLPAQRRGSVASGGGVTSSTRSSVASSGGASTAIDSQRGFAFSKKGTSLLSRMGLRASISVPSL
eukprot:TRINITY_DN9673_c0_g1_i1.p1 TRINITY_DN9673_c0_g1~~TRINITY_DN9673_c0_g1_i1.p1  ORF type:complete len:140 (-),score=16.19 TRINITY_DN9673_c0_g1_i1:283-702(-)